MIFQHPIPAARAIRVAAVDASEQTRKVDEAIAHRAYEIFERRGGVGWHEIEDWRTAESQVRSKLCIGLTYSEDSLLVSCSIGRFEEDSVEIWVAPRQMTICGKPVRDEKQLPTAHGYRGVVFRVVALPAEVEPHRAFTIVRQHFLEIHLPMIHAEQREHRPARAA